MRTIEAKIDIQHLERLKEMVERLTKAAAKVGAPAPILTVGESETSRWRDSETGEMRERTTVEIAVDNAHPQIEGYEFVASIQHFQSDDGYQNLVRFAPNYRTDDPAALALGSVEGRCDHCGVRRSRNKTFILAKTEDGSRIQVGATCMKDFSGHTLSLYLLEAMDELRGEIEGGFSSSGGSNDTVLSLMLVSARIIATFGYQKSDSDHSTKSHLITALDLASRHHREYMETLKPLTPELEAEVIAALDWVATADATTNYMQSLKTITQMQLTERRYYGYIVSILPAYRRSIEKDAERAQRAAAREQEVTAPVIEGRVEVVGTIISYDIKENDFGVRTVITVKDHRGFKVWGTCPRSIDYGDLVNKQVRFTAEIEKSDRDETFGFFKRPTKAQIIEAE